MLVVRDNRILMRFEWPAATPPHSSSIQRTGDQIVSFTRKCLKRYLGKALDPSW